MMDTTRNHLRASDVQLPATREEGAADAVTNTRAELESLVHHRDMAKFLL